MKVALFGAGRIGKVHAASIKMDPRCELVAVTDVMTEAAEALAHEHGIAARGADEILADPGIDAILIASSTNTHADLIEAGAKAGKAIFCEKPIDLDLKRALEIGRIAKTHDKPMMMGFNRRFDPNFAAVKAALADLRAAAKEGRNVMPASIACARAGVTTGEWATEMRAVHGEYRGPTGVSRAMSNKTEGLEDIRASVDAVSDRLGKRLRFLVGKPGLDGHSNGAEQIAFRARDCGMEIDYEGIRLTPEQIVEAARNGAHVVGLSILSGSHIPLVEEMMERMRAEGLGHVPVIVGGIIPEEDMKRLKAMGVSKVYTPKDFELNAIMKDIVHLVDPAAVAAE